MWGGGRVRLVRRVKGPEGKYANSGCRISAVGGAGDRRCHYRSVRFYHFGEGLPEYQQLANYNPPVVTRIHAGDGRLMAEFAREKRVFIPIDAMPKEGHQGVSVG